MKAVARLGRAPGHGLVHETRIFTLYMHASLCNTRVFAYKMGQRPVLGQFLDPHRAYSHVSVRGLPTPSYCKHVFLRCPGQLTRTVSRRVLRPCGVCLSAGACNALRVSLEILRRLHSILSFAASCAHVDHAKHEIG